MFRIPQLCLLVFSIIATIPSFAQEKKLYDLEKKLMKGNKTALFEIAPFFDSKKNVIELLGYHILHTDESSIAKRIVEENCLFLETEIKIDSNTSSMEFRGFLDRNRGKIIFCELAQAFLLTPLEKRTSRVEMRSITRSRKADLQSRMPAFRNIEWIRHNRIDSFINVHDPKSLLLIASELFKRRYRFNRGYHDKDEFTDLIQWLTNTEIAVQDEKGELTWHVEKEFYPEPALNLLIYFANNFRKYRWDNDDLVFVNTDIKVRTVGKEEHLFQLLNSNNDSIALDAFTQLTTCDTLAVRQLCDEYERADMEKNWSIPIFPYRFLRQMVVLTDYCKRHQLDFKGSPELQNDIKTLQSDLSFNKRRKLENKLINNLTLDDITAFEYLCLISQQSYELTYSAGRVLDIFYSNHWSQLMESNKHLPLYLKKSYLFDNLGIIGICNNYLIKFEGTRSSTGEILAKFETNDKAIRIQLEKAKTLSATVLPRTKIEKKTFDGNRDFQITNLQSKISSINNSEKDIEKKERRLVKLLSQINYEQIGAALSAIENIPFSHEDKYSFMERDWGFFLLENFDSSASRKDFLGIYSKLSEYDLYSFYLDKAEIDYKNGDNSLDYDKIYELLKYNVVVAFAGGGGGTQDNEVYSLIKLLEIRHKTTLGFPRKLCNSDGMWGCDSEDRAKEWMQYMKDNKLLKEKHERPVSFHYK